MAIYECEACGARVPDGVVVCPACGRSGAQCADCGWVGPRKALLGTPCPACGSRRHIPKPEASPWVGFVKVFVLIGAVILVAEVVATLTGGIHYPATITGPMTTARSGQSATRLADGRVLIVGGTNDSGTLSSAEVYDPKAGTFSATGSMARARTGHKIGRASCRERV